MNGTVWEYVVKAPLQVEWISPASWCLIRKHCRSVFSWKASGGYRAGVGDKLAETHLLPDISGWLPCESSSPSSPCWAQEQGNPEHRPPRSHSFSCTFANQRITITWQVSERHYQKVGSSFRRKKNQPHILYITLYVIVYNLLIPWWWCPCMEYLVFGFLKMAWNKMYNSQSYLCFCNCRDKSTL